MGEVESFKNENSEMILRCTSNNLLELFLSTNMFNLKGCVHFHLDGTLVFGILWLSYFLLISMNCHANSYPFLLSHACYILEVVMIFNTDQ